MRVLIWRGPTLKDPQSAMSVFFNSSMAAAGIQVIALDGLALAAVFGPKAMQDILLSYAKAYRVDAVLVEPSSVVEPAFLDQLKARGIALVVWRYDDILWFAPGLPYPKRSVQEQLYRHERHCHLITTGMKLAPATLARMGLPVPVYVPWPVPWQGYHADYDGPVRPVITYGGSPKWHAGQPETWRVKAIRALAEAGLPIEVYGDGWAKIPGLEGIVRSGTAESRPEASASMRITTTALGLEDYFGAIHSSQVNLTLMADWRTIPNPGIRGAHAEITSCGSMMLTNYSAELADLFRPGEEFAAFTDIADLVAKARYYIERPEECREMGRRARQAAIRAGGWDRWWGTVAELLEAKGHHLDVDSPPAEPDPAELPVLRMAATAVAHAYEAQGHKAMAAVHFRDVLALAPDDYAAHAGLARVTDSVEDSLEHWRQAAGAVGWTSFYAQGPKCGLFGCGTTFPGAFRSEAAVGWYSAALALKRTDAMADALSVLVENHYEVGKWIRDLAEMTSPSQVLALAENFARRWSDLDGPLRTFGNLLSDLGRLGEAGAVFEQADALEDTLPPIVGAEGPAADAR